VPQATGPTASQQATLLLNPGRCDRKTFAFRAVLDDPDPSGSYPARGCRDAWPRESARLSEKSAART